MSDKEHSRIAEIQHVDNRGTYAIVHVLLEDSVEGTVYVGGDVEYWLSKGGAINVRVKRQKVMHKDGP